MGVLRRRKSDRLLPPYNLSLPDGITGRGWEAHVCYSAGFEVWVYQLYRDGVRVGATYSDASTRADAIVRAKRRKDSIMKIEKQKSLPSVVSLD